MRTVRRLRLRFLLDLQSSPTVLPLSLSHHVETRSSPSKVFCSVLEPAVALALHGSSLRRPDS
jgi:hypothetical protein